MDDFEIKAQRISKSFDYGKGTGTPWGNAQSKTKYAIGVNFYDTARHGGFHVSASLQQKMPAYLRKNNGWYEEDCEWALMATAFPHIFTITERELAEESLRNWHPDAWEQHYGRNLEEGESHVKDRRIFTERHKADYVVIAASSTSVPGVVEVVATLGGERYQEVSRKTFVVPSIEYDTRGRFGFIIDPTIHKEVEKTS